MQTQAQINAANRRWYNERKRMKRALWLLATMRWV